jgi:hypothetical protein
LRTTHTQLGRFFMRNSDIGAIIFVLSFLGTCITGAAILFFGYLWVEYSHLNIAVFFAIKPLWLSLLLFPVFLYLIDRSGLGAGR